MFEFKIGKKEGWAQIAWDSWGVFDYDMKIRIINIFFQLFMPRTQYSNAEFSNLLKTLKLNTNMSYSSGCMIIFFQFLSTKKCSSLTAGIWRLLCPGWPHGRIRWWYQRGVVSIHCSQTERCSGYMWSRHVQLYWGKISLKIRQKRHR